MELKRRVVKKTRGFDLFYEVDGTSDLWEIAEKIGEKYGLGAELVRGLIDDALYEYEAEPSYFDKLWYTFTSYLYYDEILDEFDEKLKKVFDRVEKVCERLSADG